MVVVVVDLPRLSMVGINIGPWWPSSRCSSLRSFHIQESHSASDPQLRPALAEEAVTKETGTGLPEHWKHTGYAAAAVVVVVPGNRGSWAFVSWQRSEM